MDPIVSISGNYTDGGNNGPLTLVNANVSGDQVSVTVNGSFAGVENLVVSYRLNKAYSQKFQRISTPSSVTTGGLELPISRLLERSDSDFTWLPNTDLSVRVLMRYTIGSVAYGTSIVSTGDFQIVTAVAPSRSIVFSTDVSNNRYASISTGQQNYSYVRVGSVNSSPKLWNGKFKVVLGDSVVHNLTADIGGGATLLVNDYSPGTGRTCKVYPQHSLGGRIFVDTFFSATYDNVLPAYPLNYYIYGGEIAGISVVGNPDIGMSWDDAIYTPAMIAPFIAYNIYLDGGSSPIATTTAKGITLTNEFLNLSSFSTGNHYLKIRTVTKIGEGPLSGEIQLAFSAPTAVQSLTNSGRIVSWSAPVSTGKFTFPTAPSQPYETGVVTNYTVTVNGGTPFNTFATSYDVGTAAGSYTVAVVANCLFGRTSPSSSITFTPTGTVPSAPSALSIGAGFNITWTAPSNSGGSSIQFHSLYLNGAKIVSNVNDSSISLPAVFTSLIQGSNTLQLSATNATGESVKSTAITFTANPPTQPSFNGSYGPTPQVTIQPPTSWGSLVYGSITYALPVYAIMVDDGSSSNLIFSDYSNNFTYFPKTTGMQYAQAYSYGKYNLVYGNDGSSSPQFIYIEGDFTTSSASAPNDVTLNSSFVLSWNNPASIGSGFGNSPPNYRILIDDTLIGEVGYSTTNSFNIANNLPALTVGKQYDIRIQLGGAGAFAPPIQFYVNGPTAPLNFKCSTTNVATWNAPSSAGSLVSGSTTFPLTVSSYTLTYGGASISTSSTSYTIPYSGSRSVQLNIRALNRLVSGQSAITTSSPINAVPIAQFTEPGLVTNITLNTSFNLSWSAPAWNGGSAITKYYVWFNNTYLTEGLSASVSLYPLIKNKVRVGANVLGVSASNTLGSGYMTSITFTLDFYNDAGGSLVVDNAGPTALDVSGGLFSWTNADIYPLLKFVPTSGATVYYQMPIDSQNLDITTSSSTVNTVLVSNATSYNISTLSNNNYTFIINSIYGTNVKSLTASRQYLKAAVPNPCSGVSATAIDGQSANFAWTLPSNTNGSGILYYQINDLGNGFLSKISTSGNSTTLTGLIPNTAYTFSIVAVNEIGESAAAFAAPATTTGPGPNAPIIGVASYNSNTQKVTVTWTAGVANSYTVTGFTIYDDSVQVGTAGASATSVELTLPRKTYTFRVFSNSASGDSGFSSSSNSVDVTIPLDPVTITGISVTSYDVTINWTNPTNLGGSSIESFVMLVSLDNFATMGTSYPITNAAATSFTQTLPAGTYSFKVIMNVASGLFTTSDAFGSAPVPPTPAPPPTPPPGPTGNNGAGAAADPYITTISGAHYKLPTMDGAIRMYQGDVNGKTLTVNATLRTMPSSELLAHNITSAIGLSKTIGSKAAQRFIKDACTKNTTMCFFESFFVRYGDNKLIINVWDGMKVVHYTGGFETEVLKNGDKTLQGTGIYSNYTGKSLKISVGKDARVYISTFDSPMIRNGIYVDAPEMSTGNGACVNKLVQKDMTITALDDVTTVAPRKDAKSGKVTQEIFADHNGTRIRNIIMYK